MGMKANSGLFYGTSGHLKYQLDIQFFASGKIPFEGRILLRLTSNQNIKNAIKELYRPGANVGNGSTAATIKSELKTGKLIGKRSHITKGRERMKQLEKILSTQKLSYLDVKITKKLLNDLKKALGENNV